MFISRIIIYHGKFNKWILKCIRIISFSLNIEIQHNARNNHNKQQNT